MYKILEITTIGLISCFAILLMISFGNDLFGIDYGSSVNLCMAGLMFGGVLSLALIRFNSYLPMCVLLWLILVTLPSLLFSQEIFFDLKETWFWPLIFFLFYYLGQTNKDFSTLFCKVCFVLLVPLLIMFFQIAMYRTSLLINQNINASVNYIFLPLCMLPWLLCAKSVKWQIIALGVIFAAAVFSSKRSVCLIIILILMCYYWFLMVKQNSVWKLFLSVFLLFGGIGLIALFGDAIENMYIFERFAEIKDDGGSGRVEVYQTVLFYLGQADWMNFFFGHGHDGFRLGSYFEDYNGYISAHNDWLEVIFDYGVVCLAVYAAMTLLLFHRLYTLFAEKSQYFFPYLTSCIIFFIMSLISHLILYPTYFIFLVAFWGFVEGQLLIKQVTSDGGELKLTGHEDEL